MWRRVIEELEALKLEPRIISISDSQRAVMCNVLVNHGAYKGETLQVALSFQENSYPEYPPHFVHFKSTIKLGEIPVHFTYQFEDEHWSAYSLPPSDFWDKLQSSQKNMKTYVYRHLFRILASL